jgi:hypothetical protein
VETELAILANAGATALIGLMVSDSWAQVKERFARLFARGGATASTLWRLETSQAELMAARAKGDDALASAIEDEWRARLHHLLRSDPTVGEELRDLLNPPASVGDVYNVNSGSVRFGSVIQAGQITGAVFHVMPILDEHTGKHENEEEPGGTI